MKLDDITQFFRPVCTPVQNVLSYYFYRFRNLSSIDKVASLFKIFTSVMFIITSIGKFLDFLPIMSDEFFSAVIHKGWIISLVTFFLSHISGFKNFVSSYENRFTYEKKNVDLYSDVLIPCDGWIAKDYVMEDGKTERIFYNEEINDLLLSNRPVAMERSKRYEKALRAKIRNNTENYNLFLKYNFRKSMYEGKQFYNESKYGLSADIIPGEYSGIITAKVHKTCYFDTYLTNIIPNKVLYSNKTSEVIVDFSSATDSVKYMPFDCFGEDKVLRKLSEATPMANELGVSTLLIQNGYIRLWRQSMLAQSSSGMIVPTGSGSADWNDCKGYFDSPNGFREAVIHSMNRELWEETNNKRSVSKNDFMNWVETRITGYFRWMDKAGKSEFVGISRLKTEYELDPEQSEVIDFEFGKIRAVNIKQLIRTIDEYILSDEKKYNVSIPCIMAFCSLKKACEAYCCEKCRNARGSCADCSAVPYEVLFE